MPILNKQNEFVISVTFNCNWTCSYCSIRNKYDYRNNVSIESIYKSIDQVKYNSIVTLTGGEPGLLDYNIILSIIQRLKNKNVTLYLETNGLFILRHALLLNYFHEILYHCSQDLNEDDIILNVPHKNIRYILIIHDNNILKLKKFILKYQHIKFDIIEATYPYDITGPTLSPINKNMLLCNYINNMTSESIYRLIYKKDFDRIQFLNFGKYDKH